MLSILQEAFRRLYLDRVLQKIKALMGRDELGVGQCCHFRRIASQTEEEYDQGTEVGSCLVGSVQGKHPEANLAGKLWA